MALPYEEQDFFQKYWFAPTVLITVVNPRTDDYTFTMLTSTGMDIAAGRMKTEERTYTVKAGNHARFPGQIANIYLDQMSKMVAQDDDNIGGYVDFAVRAKYYADLIVSIEDTVETYIPLPAELLPGADNGAARSDAGEQAEAFPGLKTDKTPKAAAKA